MSTKILVTGGGGYLGGHLARTLIGMGNEVRIFDIQKTKYAPPEAEFIIGDMRDAAIVEQAMTGVGTIFHIAFVQSMSKLPEKTRYEMNIGGTENFIKASLEHGVNRFVHTSTIEIYGTQPPFPCPEDAPTNNPVGWYGYHKLESEKLLWRYHKEHGLPATALRMSTICGPGFYNHRPMILLMDRILNNKAALLAGDGSIYGDFVYYKDVIQGYLLASQKSEAIGQAFNIGPKEPSTHAEVIKAMIQAINSKSTIIKIPKPFVLPLLFAARALGVTDLPNYQFDYLLNHNSFSNEKAEKLLGYAPEKTCAQAGAQLIKNYAQDQEFIRSRSRNY